MLAKFCRYTALPNYLYSLLILSVDVCTKWVISSPVHVHVYIQCIILLHGTLYVYICSYMMYLKVFPIWSEPDQIQLPQRWMAAERHKEQLHPHLHTFAHMHTLCHSQTYMHIYTHHTHMHTQNYTYTCIIYIYIIYVHVYIYLLCYMLHVQRQYVHLHAHKHTHTMYMLLVYWARLSPAPA